MDEHEYIFNSRASSPSDPLIAEPEDFQEWSKQGCVKFLITVEPGEGQSHFQVIIYGSKPGADGQEVSYRLRDPASYGNHLEAHMVALEIKRMCEAHGMQVDHVDYVGPEEAPSDNEEDGSVKGSRQGTPSAEGSRPPSREGSSAASQVTAGNTGAGVFDLTL